MKNKFKFILVSFIFISLFFFNLTPISSEQKNIGINSEKLEPKGIRITIINDPSDSAVITWYTEKECSYCKVKYSIYQDLSDSKNKDASAKEIDGTFVYSAELKNLKSNRTYYFRIYTDFSIKSNIMNFTTSPKREDVKKLTFLVWGDSRSQPKYRRELSKRAMLYFGNQIDFIIHTGDIVSSGSVQEQWNAYFNDTEIINGFIPGYYAEGNHEDGYLTKMYDNIPLPSNGRDSRYYSFNWGFAGFLGLNTNNDEIWPHEKMSIKWLETELKICEEDKYILWKFAFMHHPIFNDQEGRSDIYEAVQTWCPLFEKYDVDMVFAGHNHYYERSFPMNYKKEFEDSQDNRFKNPENPMYYIAAGAGAPLYTTEPADYIAHYNSTYHFLLITIKINEVNEETTLTAEAWGMPIREEGKIGKLYLFDNISIVKDLPKKYLNADYEAKEIKSYVRLPDYVYFIMYFSSLGLFIIIIDRPIFKNYLKHKREIKRKLSVNNNKNKTENRLSEKSKKLKALSFGIFLLIAITVSIFFVYLNFTDEILSIALAIAVSILIIIPVNYFFIGKESALSSVSHLFLYLTIAGIIAYILLGQGLTYYLFYINFIIIAVVSILIYFSFYLSKNIKPSKISGKDSFYFGGALLVFNTILFFYSIMNLIALI
ncbi:MAG: metallophosphoesterase [Promethearchaeota archaeon]